jgi:hypothetical protein
MIGGKYMNEKRKPRLYFRIAENDEHPHEFGFIVSKSQLNDVISTLTDGISREDVKRDRICLCISGVFEKLDDDGSYNPVDLSSIRPVP